MTERAMKEENWALLVPITGVRITKECKEEFQLDRLLLVSIAKLPRIRKRIGIKQTIARFRGNRFVKESDLFSSAPTMGIMRCKGDPKTIKLPTLNTIREELALLAFSQLDYGRRRMNAQPAIKGEKRIGNLTTAFIGTTSKTGQYSMELIGPYQEMLLGAGWLKNHKKRYYFTLLDIIRGKIAVDDKWRQSLRRAAILTGYSILSGDLVQSFLWNMISLEILLTQPNDSYSKVIPQRLSTLFSWTPRWDYYKYKDKIEALYKKRCDFVHEGEAREITIKDLHLVDELLNNLFYNLVKHHKLFSSKQDILSYCQKIEAEQLLNVKAHTRPRTFSYSWPILREDN